MEPTVIAAPGDKVTLVCLKDIHFAALPPGRRRGSYAEEILGKLRWANALAASRNGFVVCAGDLFHIKSPQAPANVLWSINRLGQVLRDAPGGCGMFGVVGNHDLSGDSMGTLERQPLGNLIMAGAYWPLGLAPVVFEAESGLRVRLDGYDYAADARVILEAMQTTVPDDSVSYRMAVAHSFAAPGKSTPMFGEFSLGFNDLKTAPYHAFLWGHDHKPKGIFEQEDPQQIHLYLGSLSRAALSEDEANRPVTVAVIEFSAAGIHVEEVEVPVQPLDLAFHTAALEVERVELRAEVVDQKEAATAYLADLTAHAAAVESDDPKEILNSITTEPSVITKICDACGLH